jgi:transcriptional regulator with PAS, ATPase and Fis domain
LTNEAKNLLQKQRFPGNIRQLKNLAEQISVLEIGDRIVDEERLQYYLDFNEPKLNSTVVKGEYFQNSEGINEREILYKILFVLKKDVTELKKILLKLIESGNSNAYDILSENMSIFEDIKENDDDHIRNKALPTHQNENTTNLNIHSESLLSESEDAQFEEIITNPDVTLSLEKQEKEIIIRALMKNKNKRKYAAKDLGISERTLYRKIKQYDLEDNV